jgi:hypothetical protein
VTRSALHEKYKALIDSLIFTGIIVSGTSLSAEIMRDEFGSIFARERKNNFM